jgi:NTE family protein
VARPKTVSLVLGIGGARGLAHIGAIQWLTENGYDIRSIAGSSMGALIGGIYAAGKLPVYTEWVLALERMQVLRLLDPTFGRSGLFKGERIIEVLRELIGEFVIEDLPVQFTAVATDLQSSEELWLRKGNLFNAIRASIATPLIFTPFNYDGRKLFDGGLVNPLPIAPTLNDTTELTVAVNLSGPVEPRPPPPPRAPIAEGNRYRQRIQDFIDSLHVSKPTAEPSQGIFDIAFASMEAMQSTIAQLRLADAVPPDVMVVVPRNACGLFEYWRAAEMIALGRERTARAFAASGR